MLALTESRVQIDHALQGIVACLWTIPAYQGEPILRDTSASASASASASVEVEVEVEVGPFPIQNALQSFIGHFQNRPSLGLGSIPQNVSQVKIGRLHVILALSFPRYSVRTATKTTESRVIDDEIALSEVIDNEKSLSIIPKMGLKMKNHYQNRTNQPILRAGARARARTHRKF